MSSSLSSSSSSAKVYCQRLSRHGLQTKLAKSHHADLRRASILILLANDGNMLLTQRTLQLRSHPGQVCFPGGKQDADDGGDDWKTGLRETLEEVGLNLKIPAPETESDIATNSVSSTTTPTSKTPLPTTQVCVMETVESMNHLCVTPVVCFVNLTSEEISKHIEINPSEVEVFFWVPLDFFVTTQPLVAKEMDWMGDPFVFRKYLYSFDYDTKPMELPITGLTAHVAHEIACIATQKEKVKKNNNVSSSQSPGDKTIEGALWRLRDDDTPKPYWSERYFVVSSGMLHQYDNASLALRKSQSASKKNRLVIPPHSNQEDFNDIDIVDMTPGEAPIPHSADKFPFRIATLGGRVVWYLASASSEDRANWKTALLQSRKRKRT